MTIFKGLPISFLALALTTLSGCNTTTFSDTSNNMVKQHDNQLGTQCAPFVETDEIKMCTAHFDPVCVKEQDANGKVSYRTAGNSCSACNSPQAISYTPGECQ